MASILVIDDDAALRTVLAIVIREAGHEVLLAGDGREALAQMARRPADRPVEVVVTDIMMPEADGVEVIITCRRAFPAARIIAISGGPSTGDMDFLRVAEKLGAAATLAKPFVPAILLDKIEELLAA
jgi:CheY-like chemotaxis protein